MDIEEILQQFELIEKKVAHVVQVRRELEQQNRDLSNRVEELEQTIQAKAEAERKHDEITTLVQSKIDSLIGRLEGIADE